MNAIRIKQIDDIVIIEKSTAFRIFNCWVNCFKSIRNSVQILIFIIA